MTFKSGPIFRVPWLRIFTIFFNTRELKSSALKEAMAVVSESVRAEHLWLFSRHIKQYEPPVPLA
jgi:hypothetical protein